MTTLDTKFQDYVKDLELSQTNFKISAVVETISRD